MHLIHLESQKDDITADARYHVYQNIARVVNSFQFLGTLSQISEEWCLQVCSVGHTELEQNEP